MFLLIQQIIDMKITIDNKESKISQLESRLRKYDSDFVSGNLQPRESKFRDSISDRLTCHSRTVSRDTMLDSDAMKKDRTIYELKVKMKDQEQQIQRLELQLSKNLDALRKSSHRYTYM